MEIPLIMQISTFPWSCLGNMLVVNSAAHHSIHVFRLQFMRGRAISRDEIVRVCVDETDKESKWNEHPSISSIVWGMKSCLSCCILRTVRAKPQGKAASTLTSTAGQNPAHISLSSSPRTIQKDKFIHAPSAHVTLTINHAIYPRNYPWKSRKDPEGLKLFFANTHYGFLSFEGFPPN